MGRYSQADIHKAVNVGFAPKYQINERGALAGSPQHFAINGFGKSWFEKRDKKFLAEVAAERKRLLKESRNGKSKS